jgi:hypothetical protein
MPAEGTKPKIDMLKPEVANVADPPAGVRMWKIPYAKVNGNARSLLVVSSRSQDDLQKSVKIPKTYVLFKWDFAQLN